MNRLQLLVLPLVLFCQAPLAGQSFLVEQERRAEERAEAFRILNDPSTLRLSGDARIPEGRVVEGPLGVVGGSLTLRGTILGDVVILNGDLIFRGQGKVEGNVTVLGGVLRGDLAEDPITGQRRVQSARVPFRVRGEQVEEVVVGVLDRPSPIGAELGQVTVRPILRNAGAFNRVEGLPLRIGGRLEYASRNPLEVEVAAIWRSASGFNLERDQLGHDVRLRQGLGGAGQASVQIRLFDEIVPLEMRGISSVESSFSTFFLRRDQHDHMAREGWSLTLEGRAIQRPLQPRIEYREETHASVIPRDPWTLRDRSIPWRPEPTVAEGTARSLQGTLVFDTRNSTRDPSSGWWAEAWVRRRVGGTLTTPETLGTLRVEPQPLSLGTDAHLDVRQYLRVSPTMRLRWQFLVSGALDGAPLPPQYQRTLGGEGSLPGHPFMVQDCGARQDGGAAGEFLFQYGCDGVVLGRIEVARALESSVIPFTPAFILFGGAGKGWIYSDESDGDRSESPLRADVGVGITMGAVGAYWAIPVNKGDRGINFFIRLNPRF